MRSQIFGQWMMFFSDEYYQKNPLSGEWIIFFNKDRFEYVTNACQQAVKSGIVKQSKHTEINTVMKDGHGIACFKVDNSNGVNRIEHNRILQFLLQKQLIPKTKAGKYTNIRFKMVSDGKGTHTGKEWNGFSLSEFVNLEMGTILDEKGLT